MKKKVILFWVIFFSLTCSIPARDIGKELRKKGIHVACLSEEDKINLQINKLEHEIRQQNIGAILGIVSPDYLENNFAFDKERLSETLEGSFSVFVKNRGFSTQMNEKTGWKVTATQDFYIRNAGMQIDLNKAKVQCEVGFFLASDHVTKDTLTFSKVGSNWFLTESEHFFSFVENTSAKISNAGRFVSVFGDSPILSIIEEDFVSTNLLAPTLLYSYQGYIIPRMSMNMCQQLWGFTDGFITPYGILADIEICEGGPDFNHDYLFITDPMANNIVASDQDNWLSDFGEWGDGVGQFAGPYGICTVEGTIYFVADMFNNRVTAYEYYNQLDQPQWVTDLNLYAYFNRPRDVEAKDRNRYDLQDKTYIAVADENNHRLAFFLWFPFDLRLDRYYGEYGSGEGQFMWPTSVCFGRDPQFGWQTNDIFVTDYGNRRLVRLYADLTDPYTIHWRGTYQFPTNAELTSVDVDNKGLVYVVDRHNAKVYKLAPSQAYPWYFSLLGIWGEKGTQDGQLYYPNTLQVAHGRYVPYPNPWIPLPTPPGDVFITESWGDQTGVRRFVIAADVLNLSAYWVPYNEDTGEGNFIWWEYSLSDFATVTEEVLLGAEVCTTYNEGSLNWGSQAGSWPVDGHPHGTYYTVKITAASIYDPTIVVEKSVDVYVDTFTIHNPIITRGIRCKYLGEGGWCDGCWQCIKEDGSYTLDVIAFDPDGDSLFYEWHCDRGRFFDDSTGGSSRDITTFENHVCYFPPSPPDGQKPPVYESVLVRAKDPYGGKAADHIIMDSYLYPSGHTCLCGDVDDDSTIDLSDVLYLISYLYKGGPPPPDPIERGDVNNDCLIDLGDVNFLTSYLYHGGSYPECYWIHD